MSWDRRRRLVTVRTSGNEVWKAPGLGRAPKVECITVGAEGGTWDVGHGCNTCRRISGRILIFRSIKRIWWGLVAPKTHTHTPTQLCPRTPPPAYGPHTHLDQRNGHMNPSSNLDSFASQLMNLGRVNVTSLGLTAVSVKWGD